MVIPPKDRLVSFKFDEVVVAFLLELLYDLICLEPSAVEDNYILYLILYVFERFAIFMWI